MTTSAERVVRSAAAIGRAVRARREALHLTQQQAAERGITNRYAVMKIEDGTATKQLQTLLNVLYALDLELVVRHKPERPVRDPMGTPPPGCTLGSVAPR